jgi:hypothetical protein
MNIKLSVMLQDTLTFHYEIMVHAIEFIVSYT